LISHLLVPIDLFFVEIFKPILLSTKQTNNLVVWLTPILLDMRPHVHWQITREQSDTSVDSYSKGSYAKGDDIVAGMLLTKDGKLDYPKPPPKALSVAPKTAPKPPAPPASAGGNSTFNL